MKAVEIALYSALSGDDTLSGLAAGGVFNRLAPEGQSPPYVVFSKASGIPDFTFLPADGGSALSSTDLVYVVKAVTVGFDAGPGQDIAARIDALLTDNVLDRYALEGGGEIVSCRRESDVEYPETNEPGVYLRHTGASYRIVVTP